MVQPHSCQYQLRHARLATESREEKLMDGTLDLVARGPWQHPAGTSRSSKCWWDGGFIQRRSSPGMNLLFMSAA